MEPKKPENPQIILADSGGGVADEPDAPSLKVGAATEWIEYGTMPVTIQGVDRQVAAARIGSPVIGEGNGGVPPVRGDVGA